ALDGARLGRSAEETLAEYGVPSPGVVLGAIEATEDYDATRLREELGALQALNTLPPDLRERVLGADADLPAVRNATDYVQLILAGDREVLGRYQEALGAFEGRLQSELVSAEQTVREAQGRVNDARAAIEAASRELSSESRISNWTWIKHNVVPWVENESELTQEDLLRGLREAEARLEAASGAEPFTVNEGTEDEETVPGLAMAARDAVVLRAAAANAEYAWRRDVGLGAAAVAYEQAVRIGGGQLTPDMAEYLSGDGWQQLRAEHPERFRSSEAPGLLLGPGAVEDIPVGAITGEGDVAPDDRDLYEIREDALLAGEGEVFDRMFRMLSDGRYGIHTDAPGEDGELERIFYGGLAPDGHDVRLELLRNDTPENRVAHALLSLSELTVNEQGGPRIVERMEPGEARSLVASHLADPATQADATRVLDSAVTLGVIDEAEAAAIRSQTRGSVDTEARVADL
ncbi:MAG: hypothetical protein AAFQ82_24410, partial [Myxococcota bacterium]